MFIKKVEVIIGEHDLSKDGDEVQVSAGADGLIVGDRVSTSRREPPQDAVVH